MYSNLHLLVFWIIYNTTMFISAPLWHLYFIQNMDSFTVFQLMHGNAYYL